jgi:hypothetical protein
MLCQKNNSDFVSKWLFLEQNLLFLRAKICKIGHAKTAQAAIPVNFI